MRENIFTNVDILHMMNIVVPYATSEIQLISSITFIMNIYSTTIYNSIIIQLIIIQLPIIQMLFNYYSIITRQI